MYDTGVIHGRFQVLHNDHMKYLLAGKARCNHLIVAITNPDPMLTKPDAASPERSDPESNPLTYFERYICLRDALLEQGIPYQEFSIVPLPINYPELFRYYVPADSVFFITIYDEWGRKKLQMLESAGFKTEVMWERPLAEKGICAADVRTHMKQNEPWEHLVPASTARLMIRWAVPKRLCEITAG
jgi:nicotinamide-nucleotide adenylyltransferase